MKTEEQGTPMHVSTIDITALEWFDKANGNSYFAARVVVNYQLPGETTIILPFQYGYGDHYVSQAAQELDRTGIITLPRYKNGNVGSLWQYCKDQNIILRRTKHEKCKKRELKELA